MSLNHVNMISNRLSLRKPQRHSLEILHKICKIATLHKNADNEGLLKIVQSEYPDVKGFDRNFISLCFALATGVGKTRLMGAFISYLYLSEGIKNFFVLAPNLTIYNKLWTDFTSGTPKYVFKGIGEFAQNQPLLINGDNYDSAQSTATFLDNSIRLNVFNIPKITAKDKGHFAHDDEQKNIPRIRRLSEYIGESYFDYLSNLDDLVILMDESHRYRASAAMAAINELKPILGLELTATPRVERGSNSEYFNNVIHEYPLSEAMNDGYVKEPAVATRENFQISNYSKEALEKIKLEDGVRIHENTKVELEIYARNNNQKIVKSFMLVVAIDTTHANELLVFIESDEFFDGRYKGKVITVHSKSTKGSEGDDIVEQLLTVEHPENLIEIVIHVNMLKEGWDITNLYTIVPLRAANSRTLVEQSIGRGLRLPYGKRVGVAEVDKLTIVSHDKFQEIVDHANDPDSLIRKGVIIGKDIPDETKRSVIVNPLFGAGISSPTEKETKTEFAAEDSEQIKVPLFESEEEVKVAEATHRVIQEYEQLSSSAELQKPEIQEEIVKKVTEEVAPQQLSLDIGENLDVKKIVEKATNHFCNLTIDIPKIVVTPKGEFTCTYNEFDIDVSNIQLQPVSNDILIQHLHSREQYTMESSKNKGEESRFEDYLVRGLIDFDDICYDEHAAILYTLSSQVVNHLKSYLSNDEEVLNVLQFHQKTLVNLIHAQMQEHFVEIATDYEVSVTKGFYTLKSANYSAPTQEHVRTFRDTIPDGQKSRIRSMLFSGFRKCLYPVQKFDSDSERRFVVIIENDSSILKWFKPAKNDIRIYVNNTKTYEPDFIIETDSAKYICEIKREDQISSEEVEAKTRAANLWCERASAHAREINSKEWHYMIIPHTEVLENRTFDCFL